MPAKRPKLVYAFCCSNKRCGKSFKTVKGLRMHLEKSSTCKLDLAQSLLVPNNDQERILVDDDSTDASDINLGPTMDDANSDEDGDMISVVEEEVLPSTLRYGMQHTTEQYYEVKLLKILNDAHAQHYLFEQIMTWAREAFVNDYTFVPKQKNRDTYIQTLTDILKLKAQHPVQVPICLPAMGGVAETQINLVRFQFRAMLESLLTDPDLVGNISNLDVNQDNPFGMYQSPNNVLSCVNSGRWYRKAYKALVKDPKKDFLCPIIMASDEAKMSQGGKAGAWPLNFTLSIFKQHLRNLPFAWRPLGYVYDLSVIESQAERGVQSTKIKYERLHTMFRSILAPLVEIQRAGGLKDFVITLGNKTKRVNLLLPVAFIIGDIQGGDKMCCRAPTYTNTVNRLCRKCDISGDESANPFADCKNISQVNIIALLENNDEAKLAEFNQYPVRSAFFDLCYGGCKYGIFSAGCPTEPLHALENGIISDAIRILFVERLKDRKCAEFDRIVRKLTLLERQKYLSSGSDKEMPRLLWKQGVTTLTDLTASQKVGILTTITVVALTEEGSKFFTAELGVDGMKAMVIVYQMLLSYWMWLKKAEYWQRGDTRARAEAKWTIRAMLQKLTSLWPRENGNGWEKPKVHEQLHVPDDIERNGCPRNYHTGPTENHHIHNLKNHAKTTQGRRTVLDWQIGKRYFEANVLDSALRHMEYQYRLPHHAITIDHEQNNTFQGTRADILILNGEDGPNVVQVTWRNKQKFPLPITVQSYLAETYRPGDQLQLFTEYSRSGNVFRAHPFYHTSGGPWHDWVMFRWNIDHPDDKRQQRSECQAGFGDDPERQQDHLYAPGQLLAFIEDTNGNQWAIARCCEYKNRKDSFLTNRWKQEYVYSRGGTRKTPFLQAIDLDSIVRHCLMIPFDSERSEYIELWSTELWGDQFLGPARIALENDD